MMETRIRLKSGHEITVRGTAAEVTAAIKELDAVIPDGYYMSSSKGLVPVSTMNDVHIMNALRAIYRAFTNNLETRGLSVEEFAQRLKDGPAKEPYFMALFTELLKRAR